MGRICDYMITDSALEKTDGMFLVFVCVCV